MDRVSMVNRIGVKYLTSNIEGGEFSYAQKAGGLDKLAKDWEENLNTLSLILDLKIMMLLC